MVDISLTILCLNVHHTMMLVDEESLRTYSA